MKHFDAHTILDAKKILQEEGIAFDRVCVEVINCVDRYTGSISRRNGVHIYFMREDCDVAYLTPDISCFSIHEEPRKWSPENLANLRYINERD